MRYKAVNCMSRSYRPTIPVSYVAQVLSFTPRNEGDNEKDSDGLGECVEWLKAHGACLIADNNGEMQLDTKVCSISLYSFSMEYTVSFVWYRGNITCFLDKVLYDLGYLPVFYVGGLMEVEAS